jgi:hypothetical protein
MKFEQKSQEFSSFHGIISNKNVLYGFLGGLAKNQIDFSCKGRSGEGKD